MLEEWQIRRYSRQLLLDAVGGVGQRRLLDARVSVPQLDVAGRACALWLARAGIGSLALPDDVSPAPAVDPAGLLLAEDAGRPMADAARQRLSDQSPGLRFVPHGDLTADAAGGAEGALDVIRRLLRPEESP